MGSGDSLDGAIRKERKKKKKKNAKQPGETLIK
jgi:hypothetical protein